MKNEVIVQKLSSSVRARLLFKREVEIDRITNGMLKGDYLRRVIEVKSAVDRDMVKLMLFSVVATFFLYLVGAGGDANVPAIGMALSDIPGVQVTLSLLGSFTLAMSVYSFYNSQAYAALIDQVILDEAEQGRIDPDIIKASYEIDWLLFKTLRQDFSFFFPPYIRMQKPGLLINRAVLFLLILVSVSPFIFMLVAQPYLTITMLSNSFFETSAKIFSALCSISAWGLIIVSGWSFRCDVDLFHAEAIEHEESHR